MNEILRAKLEKTIERFEIVQYVYITKDDAFYLFKESAGDREESWGDEHGAGSVTISALDSCVIFHKDKLIEGKDARTYVEQYRDNIDVSPEFPISNILEENKGKVKIHSPDRKHINKLFIEIGLFPERRGKGKKVSEKTNNRNKLIIKLYKEIVKKTKKKKPFPINSIYKKLPEGVSFATIRRVLKEDIKK